MHYIAQIAAMKLPVLAGAGILGVSVAGVTAGAVGATLSLEGELISAAVAMIAAGWAVAKRHP